MASPASTDSDRTTAAERWAIPDRAVAEWSATLGEARSVAATRLAALAELRRGEGPDRTTHLWRYTDPAELWPAAPVVPTSLATSSPIRAPAPPPGGAVAVLAPASLPAVALSVEASRAGVQLLPLSASGALSERFSTVVSPAVGPFEALNTAAWSTGLCVQIPRRARVAGPIRLVLPAMAAASLPRILVLLEAGAEATILEEHVGGAPGRVVVSVSELVLGPGARAEHVIIESWEPGTRAHLSVQAALERDASLLTALVGLGGSRVKADLGTHLDGQGARSELAGFLLATESQQLDHHTAQRHQAPHTSSNMDLRVALAGRARSTYTGLIRIEEHAVHSEAYQEERNLLLSPDCRADAIPELEILTHEVHCTHGSTSAPVDPEQLFFLASRGIPRAEAEPLIVRGFFESTLQRLPELLREDVARRLERKLDRAWTPSDRAPLPAPLARGGAEARPT